MSEANEKFEKILNHAKVIEDAERAAKAILEDSEFLATTSGYKRTIAILDVIPFKKSERSVELKIIGIDVLTSKVVLLVDNHGLSKGVYIPGHSDPIRNVKPNDVISLLCDLNHTSNHLNVLVARGPAEFMGTTNIAKLEQKYQKLADGVPNKFCGYSSTADELLSTARRYPGKTVVHRVKINSKINLHKGKYQIKVNFKDSELKSRFATLNSHAAKKVTDEKCYFRGYALIESQMKDDVLMLYVISLLQNPISEEKYNKQIDKALETRANLIYNIAFENAIDRTAGDDTDDPFLDVLFESTLWDDDEVYDPFAEEYFYDEDGNEINYEEEQFPSIDSYFNINDYSASYGDFEYDGHNMHIVDEKEDFDINDLVPDYIRDPGSVNVTDEDIAKAERQVEEGRITEHRELPNFIYMNLSSPEFATDFMEFSKHEPITIEPDEIL